MAAFVAVKPLPAAAASLRPALGFGHGGGRLHRSKLVTSLPVSLRRRALPSSLRCSAEENPEPADASVKSEVVEKPEEAVKHVGSSIEDFGGWSPDEPEPEGSWKAGALRFGAGAVLAIGVSLISYSYFEKQGKKITQSPPPQASSQETKVLDKSSPQQENTSKTSSPGRDFYDDDVTFDDYSKMDDDDDFDEDDYIVDKQQDLHNAVSAEKPNLSTEKPDFPTEKPNLSTQREQPKVNDAKAAYESDSDTQGRDWKVVVPAFVDRMHELALTALQALKIVEDKVDPGAVCTRRSYARWLIATSSILNRSSANKVLPAMYIEEETELAFDDITPEDPDFAAIQGLAEAGLIPSKLSHMDSHSGEGAAGVVRFSPDSPLTRQDLVAWKVALHHRSLPAISKEDFQEQSGFMDADRIDSSAWPAIVSDLYSGDTSIIATAFGFTRMLQPQKPVTNGQAAVALAYGDSSEQLGEEIARLEAEKIADDAVAADAAMEARTQQEVKALFDGEIGAERKRREETEKQLQGAKATLEKVTAEREQEKEFLLKSQAAVEAQKNLLREIQQKVDEQLQSLAAIQVEVTYEKENLEKLIAKAEEDLDSASKLKNDMEAEKKSLILARLWAEEEAEKARTQYRVLEEARERWASRGIEVNVDKSIDEDSIPGPSWRYSGGNTELDKLLHRAPIQDMMDKGEDVKTRVNNAVLRYWHAFSEVLRRIYERIVEWLGGVRWRITELSQGAVTSVSDRVQDTGSVVSEKLRCAQSSVSNLSAGAVDGTKRFADGCRVEIGKISQRFKHD